MNRKDMLMEIILLLQTFGQLCFWTDIFLKESKVKDETLFPGEKNIHIHVYKNCACNLEINTEATGLSGQASIFSQVE